jgi:hypothetical protein
MRKMFLGILLVSNSLTLLAQKTFVDGMPLSIIDGNTKTVIGNVDTQNFDGIKLSSDGILLFAYKELFKQILIIDAASNVVTDTLSFVNNVYDFEPGSSGYLYYSENPTTYIYKLDLTTKTVVDSVSLNQGGSAYLERRPGTDEIWTTKENQLYYFTINDMTLNTVSTGFAASEWISTLEFNSSGSLVYFFARAFGQDGELKKMDAVTKVITGTLATASSNGNLKYFLPSDDDATFYLNFWGVWPNEPSKLMVGNIATLVITDSLGLPYKPFDMFEHPNGNELWVVYHYNAKIGVLDRTNNLSIIDSIDVGANPKTIVFTDIVTENFEVLKEDINWNIYPNPASSFVTIENEIEGEFNVTLRDVSGKIVMKKSSVEHRVKIYIRELPKSIYFVGLFEDQKRISVKKLIVY